jgi:hypothetical protein
MERLVITNGIQQGRVLRLRPGLNRLGRSVDNHFQIPDPSISSAHCEVTMSETGLSVRDLNSTNGTFIDGAPVHHGDLQEGQLLQLGSLEMRVEGEEHAEPGPSVAVPDVTKEEAPVSLTLADGSAACANHPETAGIYRCTKCQVTLCDSCVRLIRRIAGDSMAFCSLCAGLCESLLPPPPPPPPAPAPKKGFLRRFTQRHPPLFRR